MCVNAGLVISCRSVMCPMDSFPPACVHIYIQPCITALLQHSGWLSSLISVSSSWSYTPLSHSYTSCCFLCSAKKRFTCVTKCPLYSDSVLKRGLMRRVEVWLRLTSEWWTWYRTLWTIYEMLYLEWQKPPTAVHVELSLSFPFICDFNLY